VTNELPSDLTYLAVCRSGCGGEAAYSDDDDEDDEDNDAHNKGNAYETVSGQS
jgi:hypothetical protein